MRILTTTAAAAAAIIAAFGSGASAQTADYSNVAQSAGAVFDFCENTSDGQDLTAACACFTGYMGGALGDRDYETMAFLLRIGEMTESGAPQADIEKEIFAYFNRGFTQADVERVAGMIEGMVDRGDAVCGQFTPQSVT